METKQKISRLRIYLIIACVLMGWLTGASVDRFVVQFPAWAQLDIHAWAQYSRHADLGNGLFLYPFLAIGGFLVLMAAAIIIFRNRIILKIAALPVYMATLFALLGLVFTIYAAPVMLSIKTADDAIFLHNAYHRFYYWSSFRLAVQLLSFFFCIWALIRSVIIKTSKYVG